MADMVACLDIPLNNHKCIDTEQQLDPYRCFYQQWAYSEKIQK